MNNKRLKKNVIPEKSIPVFRIWLIDVSFIKKIEHAPASGSMINDDKTIENK